MLGLREQHCEGGCPLSHHIIYVVTVQYTGNVSIHHMVWVACQVLLHGVSVSPFLHFILWNKTVKCSLPWTSPKIVTNEFLHSCMVSLTFYSSWNIVEREFEPQVAKFIDDTSGSHPASLSLRPLVLLCQE